MFWQDLRYSLRMARKNPGFTAVAVLTLALGIGANAAIFSVANAVLFRPLPFKDHHQLAMLWEINPQLSPKEISVIPGDYLYWREHSQTFDQIAAMAGRTATLTNFGEPERIAAIAVSTNFFSLLGVAPFIGRGFLDENSQPGKDQVCLITQGLWARRFGSDPAILGKELKLSGRPFTIIGVLPQTFQLPTSRAEIWLPLILRSEDIKGGAHMLSVVGRLKRNVSLQQGQTELNGLLGSLSQQSPRPSNITASLIALQEQGVTEARPALLILLGAVGFLLLIACANVANLLLARAAGRSKEFAIRAALGAKRFRLARQMFTESLLLTVCGGGAGLLLAIWSVDFFVAIGPKNIPRLRDTHLDVRVIGFAFALAVLSAFLSGLAPVLRSLKVNLNEALKEGGRGISRGFWQLGLILVAEISLSIVLLIGAGLLINSYARLMNVDPGLKTEHVLAMNLSLPASRYREDHQRNAFFQSVLERVAAVPGVQSAAMIQNLPFAGGGGSFYFIDVEGRPPAKPGEYLRGEFHAISPDYFRTLSIPMRRGRAFTERDTKDAPGVIIITESMARTYFPSADPIGKQITILNGEKPRTVIGVVGDVKQKGLDKDVVPEMYVPYPQFPTFGAAFVAHTTPDPLSLLAAIKEQVWAVDKELPIYQVSTMDQLLAESVAQRRFNALLLGVFAGLALLLASVGLYGVMSYAVSQSTREIGIRLALGAQAGNVLKLVMGQGMVLTLIGLGVGIAGAFGLTRLLSNLLYGVTATDPLTFIAVSVLLMGVAFAACYLPARRATKVDPMVALRHE